MVPVGSLIEARGSVPTSECVHVAQSLLVSVCMWLGPY